MLYLVLSVLPNTVTIFVISFHRIHQNTSRVIVVSIVTAILSLGLSIAGAPYGLPGVGLGWLIGRIIGAAFALATIKSRRIVYQKSLE